MSEIGNRIATGRCASPPAEPFESVIKFQLYETRVLGDTKEILVQVLNGIYSHIAERG